MKTGTKEKNSTYKNKFIQPLIQIFSDEIPQNNQITMKTS